MKKVFILLLSFLLVVGGVYSINKSSKQLKGEVSFLSTSICRGEGVTGEKKINCREGLVNFYKKVSQNDTIRVAYFGGSITAAAGWRVKSFNWLKEKYPQCNFVEINAALGGTGSDLGAFRLANDVLKHKPDLVFIEFAVNDYSTERVSVEKQYEGIVRQIWKENPNTDICFVYTIMKMMIDDYSGEGRPESVKAAESIADYYSIPSLNFAYEVLKQIQQEKIVIKGPKTNEGTVKSFSPDGVHPYADTGHEIYFDEFKMFFDVLSGLKKRNKKHKLKKPKYSDSWENTKILGEDKLAFSGEWKSTSNKHNYFETETTGASVSFSFEGTMFGLKDIIGPQGCALDIYVDGVKYSKLRFDKYCTYDRIAYLFIPGLVDGFHKVEIKLSEPLSRNDKIEILKVRTPEAKSFPEKLENNKFRLKEVLILESR